MANIVAHVASVEGRFFTKDLDGNIHELNEGDSITKGMIVFGDANNLDSAQIAITPTDGSKDILLMASQEQAFDDSLSEDTNYEDALFSDSVNDILSEDRAFDETLYSDENVSEQEENVEEEETEAGDEKKKEEEGSSDFAARDGNAVDVNSDLRDAKFKFPSHTYETEDKFESEAIDRLTSIISEPNNPTPPATPTTLSTPKPPVTAITVTPEIVINDVTMDEENGFMLFTVTASSVAGSDISFTYETADGTAKEGTDYTSVTGAGVIKAGEDSTTIKVPIVDDFYVEDTEQFFLNLSDISPNATLSDDQGKGTILDNGIPDGTNPSEPNNPDSPDVANGFDSEDTVFVKLTDNSSVNEGSDLVHGIKLVDANGVDVLLLDGQSVTVTLTYTPDATNGADETDFTAQTTVTITGSATGNGSAIITNPTLDDIFAENVEGYTLSINTITDNGKTFENILNEGSSVTGTIGDDALIKALSETTKVILIALDENGNAILDGSGNYTFANEVNEGDTANYMALAFEPGETTFSPSTKIADQVGTIDVAFNNTSATGAGSQSATDGTQDYDNDVITTITLGTVISTATFDDYMSDNDETYTVAIDAGSYVRPTPTTGYEDVAIDTTVVTTTIKDNTVPNTPETDDGPESNVEKVIIKLVACDASGTPILVAGEYTFANEVNEGDTANYMALAFEPGETTFSPSTKIADQVGTIDVTFNNGTATGVSAFTPAYDGSEDYDSDVQTTITLGTVISTDTFDDFFADDGETYTIAINAGSYTRPTSTTGYEDVAIDTSVVTTTILDDISFGTADNAYVDEDNFDVTDSNSTLVAGEHNNNGTADADGNSSDGTITLLNIITADTSKDDYSIIFDDTIKPSLASGGIDIDYDYTIAGTVIGYLHGGDSTNNKVFQIVLDKHGTGGSDDGYTYTQYKNLDHPIHDSDDTITFDFGFKLVDDGQESATQNFTVTVNDSLPSSANQDLTLDEDSSKLIIISQESFDNDEITLNNGVDGNEVVAKDASINIYDTDKNDIIGTLLNNGDGTLTFTPILDYSGDTAGFTYSVSDSDGDTATGTIDLHVTPASDQATIDNGGTISTNEDTFVIIDLKAPVVKDDTDKNETGGTTAGDYPELLGLIYLDNINNKVQILKGSDNSVLWEETGSHDGLYILLSDGSHTQDTIDNFTADTNHITMTTAEFEALKVNPKAQDHRDINIHMHVTEYEVDVNGNKLDDSAVVGINGVTTDKTFHVEVHAVTDTISLSFDDSTNGTITDADDNTTADDGINDENDGKNNVYTTTSALTEGLNVIDLKAILTPTIGGSVDIDQSESFSYVFTDLPEGSIVTLGTHSVTADSNGDATIWFWEADYTADPEFTLTTPEFYSGTIDATITLSVTDVDSDSSPEYAGNLTETVHFSVDVTAVANDITLQVAQASGNEDAGRTAGNTSNDITNDNVDDADDIDAPENGIELSIRTTSADNDGSETFRVEISKIPDGGTLYYGDATNGIVTIDETGVVTGANANVTVSNTGTDTNGNSAWTVTIENFDNDAPLTFIPPHNSDADYVFDVEAWALDGSDTSASQSLQIDVDVKGVADIPVNDALASVSVTDTDGDSNSFTITAVEDANSNAIDLKDIFATPADLASYDADSSETLTMKVTGVDTGFDITGDGATLITGTGDGRIWFIDIAELQAGNISLTRPSDFSGEMDFSVRFITTEDEGDSATHPIKNVTFMVTPAVDTSTMTTTDTQNEDESKVLTFDFSSTDTDGADAGKETLNTFAIKMTTVDAGVTLTGSTSGVLVDSGDGYAYLDVTNGVLETVTSTLTEDSHMNGSYDFKISYTYTDTAKDTSDNHYEDTTGSVTDQAYTVTVNAITDDITLSMATTTDDTNNTQDANGNISVSDNGQFTKTLTVEGIDSDGGGHADEDSSEKFTRIEVSGVPEGITVVGGVYAGDTGGSNYSGLWYVDIADIDLDGSTTYDLVFDVDGDLSDNTSSTISVKVFNEDNDNSVEQDDTLSFTLDVTEDITGTQDTPAVINAFYQDIDDDTTHDHDYTLSTTSDTTITDSDAYQGSVLREDTQFQLSDVVHVETDDVSSKFSITIKNVPDGVDISGMTYNSEGQFYTLSGTGNQSAVVNALQNILVTPASNENTDANDIGATDLTFDVELTTYATGGASYTGLINFTASVLPVTDALDLTVVNDGVTDEDVAQVFSIALDNQADGANTTIIDGKVYLQMTETFSDANDGTDGTVGTLFYGGSVLVLESVSGVTGIADGDYYVVSSVSYNDTLEFTYNPPADRNGSVTVDTYVKNIENESWTSHDTTEMVSTKTVSFDINAVTDGYTLTSTAIRSGDEDTLISLEISVENSDSSETLTSISLDKVPDGFLVYYGADAGSAVLAQNIGDNGTVSIQITYGVDEVVVANLWNVPLDNGAIPAYIGIKPPENWSGTIPTMKVNIIDANGVTTQNDLNVTVNSVVDTLTLNTTKTFGAEGDDIELKLNVNVQDLDGSEVVKLELTGLGTDAGFKVDGVEMDSANISYSGDTYTLINIDASDINSITFVQSAMNADVSVNAYMQEQGVGGTESAVVAGVDFNVNISVVNPTSSDDTLLYSGSDIDALGGIDTITLKQDVDTIDFSQLHNIEKIDLTANGDHTLSGLKLSDVIDMTDSNNTLTITGSDTGDSIGTVTDDLTSGSNPDWTQDATDDNNDDTHTYHYSKNDGTSSISITIDDQIDSSGM